MNSISTYFELLFGWAQQMYISHDSKHIENGMWMIVIKFWRCTLCCAYLGLHYGAGEIWQATWLLCYAIVFRSLQIQMVHYLWKYRFVQSQMQFNCVSTTVAGYWIGFLRRWPKQEPIDYKQDMRWFRESNYEIEKEVFNTCISSSRY